MQESLVLECTEVKAVCSCFLGGVSCCYVAACKAIGDMQQLMLDAERLPGSGDWPITGHCQRCKTSVLAHIQKQRTAVHI